MNQLRETDPDAPQLEGLPEELAKLDATTSVALTKFCLAMFNLNEFNYVD